MFCGVLGHMAKECPKSGSRAAKGHAVVAEMSVVTLMVSSETKN